MFGRGAWVVVIVGWVWFSIATHGFRPFQY